MQTAFPVARWAVLAWFAVWLPAYWYHWGWRNFLQLCDVAVFLTVAGLWLGSGLLLSSQAVNVMVVSLFWAADAAWRLLLGRHLMGGTEYLWDERFPVWLRLLSLYHVALPAVLLWGLRRTGYDARGWKLQAAIAAAAMVAARLLDPVENYNMVYRDPFFGKQWGPAAVHIAFMWVTLVAVVYWPTHWALGKLYRAANRNSG